MVYSRHKVNLNNKNPSLSFDSFFNQLNELIDLCTPTRKLSKKQAKNNMKPWITKGIKKSIFRRDSLLKKLYINTKNEVIKDILHSQYKLYRNKIVALINSV